jgi:glycosyltransferase involved in cell wall biosynthesis
VELYAGALATAYPPYEEDFGYVTLESFLAHKPVITTEDSGGPLEFVEDRVKRSRLLRCRRGAGRRHQRARGNSLPRRRARRRRYERARQISWTGVIEALTGSGQ